MSIQMINGYAYSNFAEIILARRGAYPGEGNIAVTRVTRTEMVFSATQEEAQNKPVEQTQAVAEVHRPTTDARMKLPYSRLLDRLI